MLSPIPEVFHILYVFSMIYALFKQLCKYGIDLNEILDADINIAHISGFSFLVFDISRSS